MFLRHEIRSGAKITPEKIENFVANAIDSLQTGTDLLATIKSYQDDEADGDDLLTAMEDSTFDVANEFMTFSIEMASTNDAVNRVMRTLTGGFATGAIAQMDVFGGGQAQPEDLGLFKQVNRLTQSYVIAGAEPTGENLAAYRKAVEELVHYLAYLLLYEFHLLENEYTLDEGREPDVDVAIKAYMEVYEVELKDLVAMVGTAYSSCRSTMPIFDEYPELEEPFMEVVGPYAVDIVMERLTKEIIDDVLSGQIVPAALYDLFHDEN